MYKIAYNHASERENILHKKRSNKILLLYVLIFYYYQLLAIEATQIHSTVL
jgi:hypothetical protein